ncbi:MAG: Hydrolase, alpha/beta fold family [uncultured Blastococcus sp.]|uniref:Hydrolase, alpha/beta fold family n=1 Tax=uncultured Blastococcus sp. TaxID=217144 RepID=A0A6J4H0V5_9ACTN|nr:MAG: Hydrolase, alpha/beta fold family [uncultured Blastococcus sp.]
MLRWGLALRVGAVVRFVLVVLVRLLVLRRRRPGMSVPSSPGTVSGGTDGTWWNRRVVEDMEDRGDRLAARTVGGSGPHVVFVHGLFGQGKNWTTIAKGLAENHRVTLIDLPNHGHSPWTDRVHYLDMMELVAAELEHLGEPVTLVGHSMGGKVAMQLALHRPQLLRALVVVDIAPVEYPLEGGRTDDPDEEASPFAAFIAGMRAVDLDQVATREDADAALKAAVPSRMVRGFLLQSLVRDGVGPDGGWRWRLNLELLERDLDELRGFPEPPPGADFDGPVLWIAGASSHYVLPEDRPRMDVLFPSTRLVKIKGAGHWVHSEQPETFLTTLRLFLDSVESR